MNADQELLELAAKAAGMGETTYGELNGGEPVLIASSGLWNPLGDNSDSFELAIKLRMNIWLYPNGAEVNTDNDDKNYCKTNESDVAAATRRAIVRAAAEIGRSMQ